MRQSTKRNLRELIAHLTTLRARLRVKGQWAVKPALAAREFREEGREVYSPRTGASVMTLMRNDVSQFTPRDLDYLVQLHNAVPEVSAYVDLLEAQVCRMRGLLLQSRAVIEEAASDTWSGFERSTLVPLLDKLDTAIEETGRAQAEHQIPEPQDAQPRRRAIRLSH